MGNTTLLLNRERAAEGRIGLVLALPAGQHWPAGKNALVQLIFKPLAREPLTLRFDDAVLARELVDAQARVLQAGNELRVAVNSLRPGRKQ